MYRLYPQEVLQEARIWAVDVDPADPGRQERRQRSAEICVVEHSRITVDFLEVVKVLQGARRPDIRRSAPQLQRFQRGEMPAEGSKNGRQVFEKAFFADADTRKVKQSPARRNCLFKAGERHTRRVDPKVYNVGRLRAELEMFPLTFRHVVDVNFRIVGIRNKKAKSHREMGTALSVTSCRHGNVLSLWSVPKNQRSGLDRIPSGVEGGVAGPSRMVRRCKFGRYASSRAITDSPSPLRSDSIQQLLTWSGKESRRTLRQ